MLPVQTFTIFQVLLLSVHGAKARIMIAHFNQKTMKLDLKCSKFQQFDGFEARAGETGKKRHTSDRARPHDFNAKRDLFFRWLNPVCKGETFLKDSEDAPEVVKRKKKGKTRFVRRHVSAQSKCTQTS